MAYDAGGTAAKLAVDPREARAQPLIRPIGCFLSNSVNEHTSLESTISSDLQCSG
jgi:hypothetical protein